MEQFLQVTILFSGIWNHTSKYFHVKVNGFTFSTEKKRKKNLLLSWLDLFLAYAGSGLSSSAAFVCSSTIAIMAALNVNLPKVFRASLIVHL